MQYVSEDISPVRKKITVTVPAEEADGSLRLTLGRLNDEASVRTAAVLLVEAIETERRL